MALQAKYNDFDAIPDELKKHYIEHAGKWVVDIPEHRERFAELNGEAKHHRERADAAQAALAAAQDPERLAKLEKALAEARSSERKAIVETSLLTALDRGRATAEGVALLTEKLAQNVAVEIDDNGHRRVVVTGLDGMVAAGGYKQLVDQAAGKWPSLFLANGAGGGGAPTRGAGPKGGNTITRAEFDALGPAAKAGKVEAGIRVVDA